MTIKRLHKRFSQPDGWQWGYFNCSDRTHFGHQIRYGFCHAASAKGLAVIAPGRTQTSEEYFEFARDLLKRDFSIAIMDWQGQGGSYRFNDDNSRQHSNGFDDDVRDFDLFLNQIKTIKGFDHLSHSLYAHSMGGNISLRHMAEYEPSWDHAVMIAPMIDIKIPPLLQPITGGIIGMARMFGQANQYAPGFEAWSPAYHDRVRDILSSDPVRGDVQKYWYEKHPELQCGGVTYAWINEALSSIRSLKNSKRLGEIKTPVLFALAELDAVVDTKSAVHLANKMPNASVYIAPQSQHVMLMEHDSIRKPLLEQMDQFRQKHLHLV